jgi:integrase
VKENFGIWVCLPQAAYLGETSQPLHDIAKIILDTGMRPEEVFRMRTENLDFKQQSIFNPHGKTKAARRAIPMSILKVRVKEVAKLGTSYAFASPHDVQRPIGSVKTAHGAALIRAKITRHFRLYDLRHTFASDDHALRSPRSRTETDRDG